MGDRKNSGSSDKVTITQHLCITSECVLTRIQYNVENIMQLAYFLRLPLAVILVQRGENNYREYYSAVLKGRFLFSHWSPSDMLIDEGGHFPVQLDLPRTNLQQHIAGVFKSGIANIKPRNYCWPDLPKIDTRSVVHRSLTR